MSTSKGYINLEDLKECNKIIKAYRKKHKNDDAEDEYYDFMVGTKKKFFCKNCNEEVGIYDTSSNEDASKVWCDNCDSLILELKE